jgi:hypothetical protein
MVDVYISRGASSDVVEPLENVPGVFTPILEVNPEQGTFLRFLNSVPVGKNPGMPLYMKLNQTGGAPLPTNTRARFEAQVAGMSSWLKVSAQLEQIAFWQQNSLTTQRDEDNVDSAKITLQHPETSPKSGMREHVDIRDIDKLRLVIDSAAAIDWAESEFYIDNNAVEQFGRR